MGIVCNHRCKSPLRATAKRLDLDKQYGYNLMVTDRAAPIIGTLNAKSKAMARSKSQINSNVKWSPT